jgi:hypothetical protein
MNPDNYEFDSYEDEFMYDKFNIDPYESETCENDYNFNKASFALEEGHYNPLDF